MDTGCLLLGAWITAASLVGGVLVVHDKRQARRAGRRVRESLLLLFGVLGGFGMLLAMVLVRHKTRKARFLFPFLACLLAGAVAGWMAWRRWC